MKILGNIYNFDWTDTSKASVEWSISGYGNYSLQTAYGLPNITSPVNVAIDVYLNEYVQTPLPPHLETKCSAVNRQPIKASPFVRPGEPPGDPVGRCKDAVRFSTRLTLTSFLPFEHPSVSAACLPSTWNTASYTELNMPLQMTGTHSQPLFSPSRGPRTNPYRSSRSKSAL